MLVPIGLCYAEMIGAFPVTGGPIVYCYRLLGPRYSYWAGWLILMTTVPVIALQGISLGWVIDALWPALRGEEIYSFAGSDVHTGDLVIGISGLAVLCWINWSGGGSAGRAQEILTALLLVSVVILMITALLNGHLDNLAPGFVRSDSGSIWPGVLAVFITTPFLLSGFESIAQGAGERTEDVSARNAASIIVTAIICATVFYVLVILAASSVAPRMQLLSADLPTAAAFEIGLGSTNLARVVLIGGICGLITSWNASIFVALRIMITLGRLHFLWPGFGRGSGARARPTVSVLFIAGLSLVGILLGRNAVLPLVIACSVSIGLTFFLVAICVLMGRIHHPNLERPFRAPGGIAVACFAAASAMTITVLAFSEPWLAAPGHVPIEAWITISSLVLGYVMWVFSQRWRNSISEEERERILIEK